MKKTMTKVLAMLIAVVMLIGCMAGCDGSGGGAKLTGEVLVITAQLNGLGEQWLRDAAEAYTYNTGVEVRLEFDSLLSNQLTTTFETEGLETADLYFVQTYEWAQWFDRGYIMDLTGMMNQKDEKTGKSLNDRMLSTKMYTLDSGEEKQSILPVTNAPTGVVYNKAMMKYLCQDVLGWDASHEYPVNTKELREVFAALEKVTSEGTNKELFTYEQSGQTLPVKPMVWSGSTGMLEMMVFPWIWQWFGLEGMVDFYSQTKNFDMMGDQGFYQVYQEMADLLSLKEDPATGEWTSTTSVPGCASLNHVGAQQRFLRGQALLTPSGSWFYNEMESVIKEKEGMADNLGFMPSPWMSDENGNPITKEGVEMPKDENGNYKPYVKINTQDYFCIPTKAYEPELAKDFLLFMFSEEYLPTVAEGLQSPVCFDYGDAEIQKTSWFAEVDDVMNTSVQGFSFAPTKLALYGKIGFYHNPDVAPYSRLVQSSFGSSNTLIDSATGKVIKSADEATGVAVTENVYKYVKGNYERGIVAFQNAKIELGV